MNLDYLKDSNKTFRVLGANEEIRVGDLWVHSSDKREPYLAKTTERDLKNIQQPLGAKVGRVPCIREVRRNEIVDSNLVKVIQKLSGENKSLKNSVKMMMETIADNKTQYDDMRKVAKSFQKLADIVAAEDPAFFNKCMDIYVEKGKKKAEDKK